MSNEEKSLDLMIDPQGLAEIVLDDPVIFEQLKLTFH